MALSSAGERSSHGAPFLREDFRETVRRRLRELGGLALIASAGTATLALATWSVNDPSLSFATNAPVRNVLGVTGAVAADLAMQLFGMATIALILPPAFWGWRCFTHRGLDRLGFRLAAWPVSLMAAAVFAANLNPPPQWPLPGGLGGAAGDAVVGVAAIAAGVLPGAVRTVAAVVFGIVAVLTTAVACGFGFHPRGDDDGPALAALSLGFAAHAVLSFRARVLLLARAVAAVVGRGPAAAPAAAALHDGDATDDGDAPPARTRTRTRLSRRASRSAGDGFELPALALLATPRASERSAPSMDTIRETASALEHVLSDFGVRGEIINARPGPVVTLYELEPAPGIKSSRVIGLADDIARSMCALSARVAVVSGRNVIGIELPNETREKVYLRELLASDDYTGTSARLPLCLGKTIGGEAVIVDLTRMPHLLIAGTTGSGKSVAINTMILSLLYRLRPEECRLIMVDPKMLELSVYDGIPHLLTPVVTDPRKAIVALKWAVREMEDRYRKMSKLGVRNIDGYNARLKDALARGEGLSRMIHTGYDEDSGEAVYVKEEFDSQPLPYLVVLVDEMADLMMVAGKDIEGAIQRLAQMARAAGIHVVLATQRPSVDVITGTIKANFPTRISFQVTSKIDSRTILGEQGAEQLLGQGDMLYMAGGGRISRTHGPFVSDEEVEKVVRHLKSQGQPSYVEAVTADDLDSDAGAFGVPAAGGEGGDLYHQAVEIVTRDRRATTSYLQRRLQIGYNRAASLIERMEQEGIIGQPNHAGKREILIDTGDDD